MRDVDASTSSGLSRPSRSRRDLLDVGSPPRQGGPARDADDRRRPARDALRVVRDRPRDGRDEEPYADERDHGDPRRSRDARDHRSEGWQARERQGDDDRHGDDDRQDHDGRDDHRQDDDDRKGGDAKDRDDRGGKKSDGDDKGADERARRKRRPWVIGIAVVVLLLLAGGGVTYWLATRGTISTDDAYTDGNIVTIAPQVAGQVIALEVTDNQFVHKGDTLFRIDQRQFVYSREQAQGQFAASNAQIASQRLGVEIAKKNFPAALQLAQANLDSAKANLALQQANYDRQRSLPKLATTQQEVETNASNYQQAKAQVEQAQARLVQAMPVQQNIGQSEQQVDQIKGQAEQARAQVEQANLNIEWSVVRAPQDGWVTKRNVNAGDYLTAGQQVMSLVTTDVWVTANYKETELDGMRTGQRVRIAIDAYPDLDLQGHVESIQRGSGSKFSAFPAENATGNFIKIVQRVPVKIVIDSGLRKEEPLPLGISVVPTVMLK